ncbi:MAG: hypothetical protein C5B50_08045 [Verrucomicrobia bacterium]|nr:MAG: hypothetical protein C5B50_08045 [Verrucomicrobiota bacterium]
MTYSNSFPGKFQDPFGALKSSPNEVFARETHEKTRKDFPLPVFGVFCGPQILSTKKGRNLAVPAFGRETAIRTVS